MLHNVDTRVMFYGFILMLIGIVIRYIIGRRRFNRRTIAGTEGFSSYEKAVFVTFSERIMMLVAKLLLVGGLLLIGVGYYNKRSAENYRHHLQQQHTERPAKGGRPVTSSRSS